MFIDNMAAGCSMAVAMAKTWLYKQTEVFTASAWCMRVLMRELAESMSKLRSDFQGLVCRVEQMT